jgi:hypothetical protein
MLKFLKIKIIYLFLAIYLSSCSNIFKDASDKTGDRALIYEAELLLDQRDYPGALTYLNQINASKYENPIRLNQLYSQIYAGACGMEMIPFMSSFGTANSAGGTKLFGLFMSLFKQKPANSVQCAASLRSLQQLGATFNVRAVATGRNDDNFFMEIVSMASIGSVLRTKADIDGTGGLGDGIMDAGFSVCTGLTDADIDQVAIGFSLVLENIAALASSGSSVSDMQNISNLLSNPALCGTVNCLPKTQAEIDAMAGADQSILRKVYRLLLRSSEYGIDGSCSVGELLCLCP